MADYMKTVDGKKVPMSAAEKAAREAEEAAWAAAAERRQALAKIRALEAEVTQRRLRDAILNQAGADWLAAKEAEIAQERAKL